MKETKFTLQEIEWLEDLVNDSAWTFSDEALENLQTKLKNMKAKQIKEKKKNGKM